MLKSLMIQMDGPLFLPHPVIPGLRGKLKTGGNMDAAKQVGELLAERAKGIPVEKVVFDRGGRLFHGRVKALADAVRSGGLSF